MSGRSLTLSMTTIIAAAALSAQTARPALSADELSAGFLRHMDSLSRYLEKIRATDSRKAADLETQYLPPLRLSVEDLRKIESISRLAVADLDAWNTKAGNSRPKDASDSVALAAMTQLLAQRTQLIQSYMSRVKASLSPAAWNVLDAFLRNQYLR